jgi:peptide/nickel transport system permease protein
VKRIKQDAGENLREYLIKRIIFSVIVIYVIASLNFVIFQVAAPMDPTAKGWAQKGWSKEIQERYRKEFGLDKPLHERYLNYIVMMFTWNFGTSFFSGRPVAHDMSWRLVNTVLLLGTALVGVIMVGVPIGILAASRRGSKVDVLAIGAGLFAWGVPTFFIQILFVLFFVYYLQIWFGLSLFPSGGLHSVPPPQDPLLFIADVARHLTLPAVTLIVSGFGSWALYTRNILLDALTQDYILTARAKGLSERTVLYRHAFRSSLPPIVTMVTLAVPGIVTGAVITEFLFSWPGIGGWYVDSLFVGDYPVVQSVVFIYAVLMVAANIVADLLYGVLDPRIRIGFRR